MPTRRRFYLKLLVRYRRTIRKLWLSNSGDWQWLIDKPAKVVTLNRILWRESVPSRSFVFMLFLSGVISTLGLLAGSTATVIGAMIIAPLMGPIIGIAYALAMANRRLLKRASLTLGLGILITVISAMVIAWTVPLRQLNPEILARSQPTLIDLGVALAAGAAGAFAKSRKHVSDAFPGVAIAVALVPPVSVIGIGIAQNNLELWSGASLLFITNLTAIIFSGIAIFVGQRYGSLERAQRGLAFSMGILLVLGVPLGVSFQNILTQDSLRRQIRSLVREELTDPIDADIQRIRVVRQRDRQLLVEIDILAAPNSINAAQVRMIRSQLQRQIQQSVILRMQVSPVQQFEEMT
ncbi:MAG: TIGR00341 family protein [Leptolyngbyaceae bacterium]|nr:TIGR00341 family protein [Leptolyngbyaceae bacterium]